MLVTRLEESEITAALRVIERDINPCHRGLDTAEHDMVLGQADADSLQRQVRCPAEPFLDEGPMDSRTRLRCPPILPGATEPVAR